MPSGSEDGSERARFLVSRDRVPAKAAEAIRQRALLAHASVEAHLAESERLEDDFRIAAKEFVSQRGSGIVELSDEDLVVESGLFDLAFYDQASGPDRPTLRSAVADYLDGGARRGRRPNAAFDGETYWRMNPDVAAHGINPLVHLLRYGVNEERPFRSLRGNLLDGEVATELIEVSGSFDSAFYSREAGISEADGVAHYVRVGADGGWDPNPDFSTAFYRARYEDVRSSGLNPFLHWLLFGATEGRDPVPVLPAADPRPLSRFERWRNRVAEAVLSALRLRVVRPGLPNRIGHLVADFDAYVKELMLSGRTRKPLYVVDVKPCNSVVVDYWRDYLTVVDGPLARRLQWLHTCRGVVDELEHDYAYTLEGAAPSFSIETRWGDRPPLFALKDKHRAVGLATLRDLGLPEGAWFVCVHSRESGYSPGDREHHDFRDSSIESFQAAMDVVVQRGGWCVRMGDPTMRPLPPRAGVVDYAHSEQKSELMDVFLCASCRFFLGTSSGLFLVASEFGVPSALCNMAPLGHSYSMYRGDICIPKLMLNRAGEEIPFRQAMASPVSEFRWSFLFQESGVQVRNNTPDEIADLAAEMLDRLDGGFREDAEDRRRQDAFRALFDGRHYSFGSSARIGSSFLRKHSALLDPSAAPVALTAVPWVGGALPNPAAGTRRRPLTHAPGGGIGSWGVPPAA